MTVSKDKTALEAVTKPHGIRRILLLVLLVAFLPSLLVQILFHAHRFKAEQTRETQVHMDVARAVAVAFRAGIEDEAREAQVVGLGISDLVHVDVLLANRLLASVQKDSAEYSEIAWLSPDGRVLAASDDAALGEDRHSDEYLLELGAKRSWSLGSIQPDRRTGAATFTIARVIQDQDGQKRGVITLLVDAERFADHKLKLLRAKDAGFILFDTNGYVAFRRPAFPFPQWQQRDFSAEDYVKAALTGKEAGGLLDLPITGHKWFTARTPVPDLGWVAGAGREYNTVMMPLWHDLGLWAGLSLLCLIVTGVIVLHYSGTILSDLRGLHASIMRRDRDEEAVKARKTAQITEIRNIATAFETVDRQRIEAEQYLREREEQLRLFVEHAPAAIAMFDQQMQYMAASSRWLADYGLNGQEILGRSHYEIFPEIPERWKAIHRRCLSGAVEHAEADRFERDDGRVQWLRWEARPWILVSGLIGGIIIFTEDITGRKQAEEKLRAANERTRSILESITDGFLSMDTEWRLTYFSETGARMLGMKREDLVGNCIWDVFPHASTTRFYTEYHRAVETKRPVHFEEFYPEPVNQWIECHAYPSMEGLSVFFRDVSDRKRADEELRRLNENLEDTVTQRTAKLIVANRELETRAKQLRALTGELTMAEQRERKRLAKILHDGLQQYLVAANLHLGGLIVEAEKGSLKRSVLEMEHLLSESIKVSRSLAAELSPPILHEAGILAGLEWLSRWMSNKYGLKVQLVMEMDAPSLAEDVKVLLFESVREILLNVVKHAGIKAAKVHLSQADDAQLRIVVSDHGRGFDSDRMSTSAYSGGGFGLFSIRERIALIGGKFEADSSIGNGARFTLTAPLGMMEIAEAAPIVTGNAEVLPNPPAPTLKGKIRILLTDDHAVMREGLARLLGQESDFEVIGEASDGRDAIEKTNVMLPDVILMDISMPGMNGIEATRIIRKLHPSIRVIGLSLYSQEERAKEMLEAGAVFYMTKSGPAADLKAAIRACIDENAKSTKGPADSQWMS